MQLGPLYPVVLWVPTKSTRLVLVSAGCFQFAVALRPAEPVVVRLLGVVETADVVDPNLYLVGSSAAISVLPTCLSPEIVGWPVAAISFATSFTETVFPQPNSDWRYSNSSCSCCYSHVSPTTAQGIFPVDLPSA